jgi:signal transduction histidine kinase
MRRSLGNRLLMILLATTMSVWVAVSVGIWLLATGAIERQIDRQLRNMVMALSYTMDAFITAGFPGGTRGTQLDYEVIESREGPTYIVAVPEDELRIALNVWYDEYLTAMTTGAPRFPPPHMAGITDDTLADGSQWRVIRSRYKTTELWLVAGLNKATLAAESQSLLLAVLSPLLAGLLLIVPLIYYAVRNGLQPLRNLEQQIAQRSSTDLHAVETDNVPREVAPVVTALNRLLLQLGAAIEKEKRITADAAHELQTPLASIKTEVQLALRHAPDTDRALLQRIIERVNRASRAVKQLTALSRLEATDQPFAQRVQLQDIVSQVLDSYREQGTARSLTVTRDDCAVEIEGNVDMLTILLDNLIRNAFIHASEGSAVKIGLTDGSAPELLIENDCREISEHEWRLITQRFYRVPGSQGDGSGLGMSIAQRICELHGAELSVGRRATGDGFSARVTFRANQEPNPTKKGSV